MECEINGIPVFYQVVGEGRPIIFMHGYWAEGEQMMGHMEPILAARDGWKRIYIDLPGMGRTPGADWIRNSDQMLDIIVQFIEKIVPDGSFTVGGYSYGGYIAQGVVSRLSKRVDGLFMVCPVIISDSKKRTLPPEALLIPEEEAVETDNPDDLPFLTRLRHYGYSFTFDLWGDIDAFNKPTVIITGKQDTAVGYHDAYTQLMRYPQGSYVALDRAGHGLPDDQRGLFNALVSEWLDRVEKEQRLG